jgi:DNA (cytosine-5)-methyltransferase 1
MAIDLCAGAGGLSMGLQDAGFDVLGVEFNADACEQHRRYVGPCELADITTWSPAGPAHLVAGGVPCQGWSYAGLRKGFDEARGHLFRHLVRVAVEARADAVLLENVPGLLTWRGGAAVSEILRAYRSAGFERTAWTVLEAADFGVPQRRRRLFVVGLREGASFSWPTPTHGPRFFASRPWVSVREAFGIEGERAHGDLPHAKPGSRKGMRVLDVDRPATTVSGSGIDLLDEPSPTVCAGRDPTPNALLRESLGDALTMTGLAHRPATSIQAHASGRLAKAGHHERQFNGAVRLSVDQCALLQDFPIDWDWSWMTKTSAHKAVGNAVPRRLAAAVGRAVMMSLVASQARVA